MAFQTGLEGKPWYFGLVVGLIAWRDLPAYFSDWTRSGNVRFLYHADQIEVAADIAASGSQHVAATSLLFGPWDQEALRLALAAQGPRPPSGLLAARR